MCLYYYFAKMSIPDGPNAAAASALLIDQTNWHNMALHQGSFSSFLHMSVNLEGDVKYSVRSISFNQLQLSIMVGSSPTADTLLWAPSSE